MKLSPWAFTDELNTNPRERKCFVNVAYMNNSFRPNVPHTVNTDIMKGYYSKNKNICAAQLFLTLVIISIFSWAVNQHIRMISEGSCDIEDYENSALITAINYILTYIHIKNCYFKLIIFDNFSLYFWSHKCSFVEKRLLSKILKTPINSKLLNSSACIMSWA